MRRYSLTPILLTLLAFAFVPAPSARAGSLRDDGNFFSSEGKQRATQALDEIQQRRGKNVVVETYQAPPSSVATGGDERARNESYRQWAVQRGQATGADLVVLITRNPSHAQVTSRQALKQSGAFTAADETAAFNAMAPAFRQKNFDQGILDGLAFIDRKLAQATGPERAGGAPTGSTQSRSTGGGTASYPPPPGGGSSNRTPAPAPGGSSPMIGCGGGGSMLCLLVVIVIGFFLIRGMMSRRSGYGGGYPQQGGYGAPPPPPGPYGGGYGQPGYGRGGGFGSGLGGGLLGGLLGGWLMNRSSHGSPTPGAFGGDPSAPSHPQGLPPTDPSTFGGGGGGDFGGGGGDFGGGGGDFGGGGGDFGGGGGGDAGGGGDF